MVRLKATPETRKAAVSKVDWARIDAMTDADIERQVAENPDTAPILSEAEAAAALVRTVRRQLGLSQPAFAARYHIPVGTLRDWEQNRKAPDSTAFAYLRVIAKEPEVVAKALGA